MKSLGSRLYLVKDSEKKFAEQNNLPVLKHCVHPRTGAAHSAILIAGKSLESKQHLFKINYLLLELL